MTGTGATARHANASPQRSRVACDTSIGTPYSNYDINVPQLFANVDRVKAKQMGVPLGSIYDTLQINLGYRCNQSCLHCHVNAGPSRTEMMSRETISDVLAFLGVARVRRLDLTGGAPELHPRFREIVARVEHIEMAGEPQWLPCTLSGGLTRLPIRYRMRSAQPAVDGQ